MTEGPTDTMRRMIPDVGKRFGELRAAAMSSGPLDPLTCELILTSSFASAGLEEGFKNHVRELLQGGTPKEVIQHAVVVPLGATMLFLRAVLALRWIDEIASELAA